jgi:transposase
MMSEKTDIVRRLRLGQAIRAIQRETGVHRTIIRRIAEIARRKGWLDRTGPIPEDEEVARGLHAQDAALAEALHPLDAIRSEIKQWVDAGYTYLAIHDLVRERYPCSEATVRRYIQRVFPPEGRPVMLRQTIAGEVMEVDFGYLGITFDPGRQRRRKTYLFSGRLRHSRCAYRERVYDQRQETFFACHVHAFEHFGGVPEKVVPDNLKAAVVEASFTEPIVNRVYQDLARHYGFLISPTLPRSPRHKGGVENDIGYVKRNFWPVFCERQRALGNEIPDGEAAAEALAVWSSEVADAHIIRGVGRSPQEIFESEERAALAPLPSVRWDPLTVATAKVQETWRIQFDKAFYSVPYRFVGRRVVVMANSTRVRIYFDHEQIASHARASSPWQYVRLSEHAPPQPEEAMKTTREGLLTQAAALGSEVHTVAEAIFSRAGVDGTRPVRALIALARTVGTTRLQRACCRALAYERPEYRCVKDILRKSLDEIPDSEEPVLESNGQHAFRFARCPGYYTTPSKEEGHE